MQGKVNKRRFILLAVLTLATLLAFWWVQPENRIEVDQDIFQVEDLGAIDKVELASDSSRITLAYQNNEWRVNDQYKADDNMIRVLFATLQQARPKRAVAHARRDSIFAQLIDTGVSVSLYEGSRLTERFFAGGNAAKTQAFFGDPSTKDVYVMAIPGYRVYVSGILELNENGWRDKFVFGFNWRNFKSLDAEFEEKPSENFTVSMIRDFFGIPGMAETDTARLNTFLDDVSLLTVDEYVSEPGLIDSLQQVKPQLQLRVTDIGNRVYRLRLYNGAGSQEVFGLIQDAQGAIFSRRKFQSLLKTKSFFRKK